MTGCFNDMTVIKCEGITPLTFIFTITKNIVVNNNADERYIFARFSTKKFSLKQLHYCDAACKGACDGRPRPCCDCLQKAN